MLLLLGSSYESCSYALRVRNSRDIKKLNVPFARLAYAHHFTTIVYGQNVWSELKFWRRSWKIVSNFHLVPVLVVLSVECVTSKLTCLNRDNFLIS